MKLIKKLIVPATLIASSAVGYQYFKENEKFYAKLVMPCIQTFMDGEQAHNFAIKMAKYGIVPNKLPIQNEECLRVNVFQKEFDNPVGCAAGFDKNGEAIYGLFKMGFGFVEIGTITKEPQEGNPKPRVFRLTDDKAIINRYGFNSEGHQAVLERVKDFKSSNYSNCSHGILGINIGKNKQSTDATEDYLAGVKTFAPYADYMVINISSPNTPGLRNLQNKKQLEELIDPILELKNKINSKLPILVKIAPDLDETELKDIAQVLNRKNKKIDGIIISNTTVQRPTSLTSEYKTETGGLSGRPLKMLSNQATKRFYELTNGEMLIIGAGGIETGNDALERIKSGASLVQIYTAMVYEGPMIVNKIKRELVHELEQQGFKCVSDAIGASTKLKKK